MVQRIFAQLICIRASKNDYFSRLTPNYWMVLINKIIFLMFAINGIDCLVLVVSFRRVDRLKVNV